MLQWPLGFWMPSSHLHPPFLNLWWPMQVVPLESLVGPRPGRPPVLTADLLNGGSSWRRGRGPPWESTCNLIKPLLLRARAPGNNGGGWSPITDHQGKA